MVLIRHFTLYWLLPILCLAGLAVDFFQPFDRWLRDQRFQFSNASLSGEIVLVDLDAQSIKELGSWPWKRGVHAQILDKLRTLGVQDIAFDVDFSSPSSHAEDALFAEALNRADGETILASFAQFKTAEKKELQVNRPIDIFAEHSWPAVVNISLDDDAKARISPLGMMLDGEPLLSIAALFGAHHGQVEGSFYIDYGLDVTAFKRVSVIDLLNGRVNDDTLAGKKVIIGASALELNDFFSVPRYGVISGHMLQALAAETLLTKRSLNLSSPFLIAGLIVGLGILFFLMQAFKVSWGRRLFVYAALSVVIEGAAIYLQGAYSLAFLSASLHICIAGFIIVTIARHIDLTRILLLISEKRADNTQKVLDQVVADNFDGIVILNSEGSLYTINMAACRILRQISPLSANHFENVYNLQGQAFSTFANRDFLAALDDTLLSLKQGQEEALKPQLFETSINSKDRHIFEYLVTMTTLPSVRKRDGREMPGETYTYIHLRDVTKKVLAEEQLAFLARFDPLTGLPNRNSFISHIAERLPLEAQGNEQPELAPFVLVGLSIERFDLIQNSLGNIVADNVVLLLAERLKQMIAADEIVAFQAVDRFLLMLDAKDGLEAVKARLQDMIVHLTAPYYHDGYGAVVGACAGIYLVRMHHESADFLLKNVDSARAMASKAGDGHIVVFDPDMDVKIQTRQQLELDLWKAFEGEELLVAHQPQIRLSTGELYGAEALVRWQHPTKGIISPEIFVGIAEQSGLIIELGDWVMQRACEEAASWPKPLQLAVNLSPLQFMQGDLIGSVKNSLKASQLDISRFDLEVTESLFIDDNDHVSDLMQYLRDMGIRIALDDFGTGYASLGYLQSFQMDKIKIDQSFIRDIDRNPQSASIVRCVAQLASDLDLQVVAEGIETIDHYRLAGLAGCTYGQGYYLSKPLQNSDFIDFMHNGHRFEKTGLSSSDVA